MSAQRATDAEAASAPLPWEHRARPTSPPLRDAPSTIIPFDLATADRLHRRSTPRAGKEVEHITITRVEPLTDDLLADLFSSTDTRASVPSGPLQKIRQRHHLIAQQLALGRSVIDVAADLDISPARIALLKNDTTFRSLIEHYENERNSLLANFSRRLEALGLDALSELHDRLEAAPSDFTNQALMNLVTTMADRVGYGPTSKHLTATLPVSPEVLASLRIEAASREGAHLVPPASRPPALEHESANPLQTDPLSPLSGGEADCEPTTKGHLAEASKERLDEARPHLREEGGAEDREDGPR